MYQKPFLGQIANSAVVANSRLDANAITNTNILILILIMI